jgi:Nitrile hydratase, alpha chain
MLPVIRDRGRLKRRCSWGIKDTAKGEKAMTEAAGRGVGRGQLERKLIQRSIEDEDFRRKLLEDPKAAMERELGTRLPEGVEVRVAEESANTIYLVLPSASAEGEGGELSDRDLEALAGGGDYTLSPLGDCVSFPTDSQDPDQTDFC